MEKVVLITGGSKGIGKCISENLAKEGYKVIVNYNICSNKNYILNDNDIFSIRGIGKFKYICVNYVKTNGKMSILIKKYM